jgi:hypothetical protein
MESSSAFRYNRRESPGDLLLFAFSDNFYGAMVVTVIAVRMMQVTINEVVDVIVMRYCLMPAPRSMFMTHIVTCAMMIGRTPVGVVGIDFQHMLLNER